MNKTPKIFGREPALIGGTIEAALALVISFGWLNFIHIDGPEGESVVMAVVYGLMGVYVAIVTKDTLLGYVLTAIKAVVALAAYYHFNLSQDQLTLLLAFVSVLAGWGHRQSTGPAEIPSADPRQHSVPIPPSGEVVETVPVVEPHTGVVTEKGVK